LKLHELHSETWLPAPIDDVFAFFAAAENLERITPSALRFRILTPKPVVIAEGSLIDYEMRLRGIPFRWRTRISVWKPNERFVDEQLRGPYRSWIHLHRFEPRDGGTAVFDQVRYALPFAPIGDLALPLVRRELAGIFAFRRATIEEIFSLEDQGRGRESG